MKRRHFCMSTLAAAVYAAHPWNDVFAAVLNEFDKVTADVNAVTGDGVELTIKRNAVQEFSDSLRGRLLLPGHEAYDDARRVINASIDKNPALIAKIWGQSNNCLSQLIYLGETPGFYSDPMHGCSAEHEFSR